MEDDTIVEVFEDIPEEEAKGNPRDSNDKFWTEDPLVLLRNFCIFPTREKSINENLNCITTLVILVAITLILLKFPVNYTILGLMAALVIIILFAKTNKKEGFSRGNRHVDPDYLRTNVTPLLSEEWNLNSPTYEIITNEEQDETYGEGLPHGSMEPPLVPYRQYLTKTNLLPGDESEISLFNGGSTGARNFMNDTFTKRDVAYRENMTRILKKKMNRRFRHNNYNSTSPYSGF